ncbi:helix-turn-helix domain-containing protein [Geomonas sp. Red32]|uniref:HVO_A0114 family putative DNA-binding protein n=1 Tax=Geomonas sp. Red32 TaxID=2912856 RepID=UPI00202CB0DB|nr:helix-turn-helix domain-containing protein [Geomonas sp. Red32]MCM0083033.1 helix-turn-helix domain-containing protein [Geomonas sp. Red32]
MRNVTVKTGSTGEYFDRVREIARQIDRGEVPEPEFTLTFEDPADMFAVMTPARLEVFRAAKADPASITAIAQRLHRDRSTVKKDVDVLVAAGLLDVEEVPLPGHGRQKFVKAAADVIFLQAVVA